MLFWCLRNNKHKNRTLFGNSKTMAHTNPDSSSSSFWSTKQDLKNSINNWKLESGSEIKSRSHPGKEKVIRRDHYHHNQPSEIPQFSYESDDGDLSKAFKEMDADDSVQVVIFTVACLFLLRRSQFQRRCRGSGNRNPLSVLVSRSPL